MEMHERYKRALLNVVEEQDLFRWVYQYTNTTHVEGGALESRVGFFNPETKEHITIVASATDYEKFKRESGLVLKFKNLTHTSEENITCYYLLVEVVQADDPPQGEVGGATLPD